MSAAAITADPTGSTAVDPTGSSTPQDVGGEGENHEDTPEVKVVDGSKGEGVPVIKPALIYTKQGEVVEVDQKIVEAVDGFRVSDGFVRKGSREQSYMYSLGVYCEEREGAQSAAGPRGLFHAKRETAATSTPTSRQSTT